MAEANGIDVGRRVRALREQRGLTQGQVAEYAKVGRGWLSLLEIGRIDEPGFDKLNKIARVLGVSVDYLHTGRTSSTAPGRVDVAVPVERAGEMSDLAEMPPSLVRRVVAFAKELRSEAREFLYEPVIPEETGPEQQAHQRNHPEDDQRPPTQPRPRRQRRTAPGADHGI